MEEFIIDKRAVPCAPESFKSIIQHKKQTQKPFVLEKFGSRKFIIVDGNYAYAERTGEGIETGLTTREFVAFISGFKRSLNHQLKKRPELLDLKIPYNNSVAKKFHNIYDALIEGDRFYNIDLSSAYWQIAHKLGYISTKVFDKYMPLDSYKHAKRLCISFLGRRREKIIYEVKDGLYIERKEVLSERDEQIFRNIRHELYSIINGIVEQLGNSVLEYNTDAVSVLPHKRKEVEDYFSSLRLIFTVNNCVKKNNIEYIRNSKLKNFKIQRNDGSRTN